MALARLRAFVALLAAAALGAAATKLGINLGNVLEEPAERPAPHDAEERFFDAYASAGFGLVRVPVRWDGHTLATPPYTINSTWLARVAEVAGWATSRGLRVVVNSHHDDWLEVILHHAGKGQRVFQWGAHQWGDKAVGEWWEAGGPCVRDNKGTLAFSNAKSVSTVRTFLSCGNKTSSRATRNIKP